jgi:hypothetical protein
MQLDLTSSACAAFQSGFKRKKDGVAEDVP